MKKILIFVALCTLLLCSACSGKITGSYSAIDNATKYNHALQQLADDTALTLSKKYPAGRTALNIVPAQDKSAFAMRLEDALRAKGFSFADTGLDLQYIVDFVQAAEKDAIYTSISLADGYAFSCVYTGKPDTSLVPSGFTARGVDND